MSCKSCNMCQDLIKQLEQHISTMHSLNGAEGVILNVILNLLSLVVTEASDDLKQLNQTVPVISKPSNRQIAVIQDTENTPVNSSRTVLSSFSNEFSSNQIANQIVVSELQGDSQMVPINTEAKMKDDHTNLSQSSKTLQQIGNLLDLPFILQQGNDLPAENVANTLVNSDGTLTPVGISLLLSNQANRTNAAGKSDLDDVADILVNKMPIPSLKGLDSNFQQLSNFYLHQLALTKLQALTNNTSPNGNNPCNTTQTIYGMSKDEPSETFSAVKNQVNNNDHADSLQNILERHKQISGLIEAMNIKPKDASVQRQQVLQHEKVLPSTNNDPSPSDLNDKRHFPPPRDILATSSLSKQKIGILSDSDGKKANTPILIATNDSSMFLPKNDLDGYSTSSDIHFSREKKDSVNLNSIQNLIMESAKRITHSQDFDNCKIRDENEREVDVCVGSSQLAKISLANNPGILIDASKFSGEYEPKSDADGSSTQLQSQSNMATLQKVLYKCEHCGITFSVLSTLASHIKKMHSEKVEFCNYCQISFTNQEEYIMHLASHRGEESIYSCQFCDKVFTSNGDFKKHVIKHTQKRPYSCGHCQKSFRDPGSLSKHERIHTGEQPFVCEVCNRGFAEKSSLRKHARVHSGEKPYKCQLCEKSFSISGNLQRHMLIHTGKRPFKCTVCSKAFNNPSHLRRHIRNLHSKNEESKKMDSGNLVVPRIESDNAA